jgi:hypothetical protein
MLRACVQDSCHLADELPVAELECDCRTKYWPSGSSAIRQLMQRLLIAHLGGYGTAEM